MAFALQLFNIQLQHTYYQDGACDDFDLVPQEATQQWMDRYGMRLAKQPGSFALYWGAHRMTDPLKLFQDKVLGITLTFSLLLKNPQCMAYSMLSMERDKVYHLTNTHDHQWLHTDSYLSGKDQVIPIPQKKVLHKLEKTAFGIVDIDLEKLWEEHKMNPEKLPVVYKVQVKAQEAIWRYSVAGMENGEKNSVHIVLKGKDDYFKYTEEREVQGKRVSVYESVTPIALADKPMEFCSLRKYSKTGKKKVEHVLIEKLPMPDAKSLKRDNKSGKLLCEDVMIHV